MSDENKNNVIDLQKVRQQREEAKKKTHEALKNKPDTEDLQQAMTEFFEAQDQLIQALISDFGVLAEELARLQTLQLDTAMRLSTVIKTAMDKGAITEEDFQKVWENDTLPELEKHGLVKGKEEEPSRVVKPTAQEIVTLNKNSGDKK